MWEANFRLPLKFLGNGLRWSGSLGKVVNGYRKESSVGVSKLEGPAFPRARVGVKGAKDAQ